MNPSKRFVASSFFIAIAISTLCNSIFSIFDNLDKGNLNNFLFTFIFSISFMVFLIKFFVDDVVDDCPDDEIGVTRRSLSMIIITWTFFIFAAIFAKDIFVSSFFWIVGLIIITIFLYIHRKIIPEHSNLYIMQNILLIILLILIALSSINYSHIVQLKDLSNNNFSLFTKILIVLVTIFNFYFFIILLLDNTKAKSHSYQS